MLFERWGEGRRIGGGGARLLDFLDLMDEEDEQDVVVAAEVGVGGIMAIIESVGSDDEEAGKEGASGG